MKTMWLHGCFSLQIGSSRISRNGLWRRGDLISQISGQVLLRPVLLQKIVDFGGGGGDGDSRRSLDKAAKNPSCTAAVAATAFGQKNYSSSSFNSWNVDDHGSSSSWRRRRRRSKAFDSSTPPPPPNAPVQAEEEEEEEEEVVIHWDGEDFDEEEEDLDHNNSEANGSSIGNSLPQQTVSSTGRWNSLPPRYKLVLTTSLAFVICNMDKVNMSVAIIPMSHQMGWNSSIAGLVQSSFFWGYAISQLPGGWLAARFTGQKVLRGGVLLWSLATAAVPRFASFIPGLLFCRLLVGLGEGVSPSAATDLIARAMPVSERSRAVATVFGGLNIGSVIGLLLAPVIIQYIGWESVFYIFGFLGVLWYVLLQLRTYPSSCKSDNNTLLGNCDSVSQQRQPEAISSSRELSSNGKPSSSATTIAQSNKAVPWRAFFKNRAVWAMIYAHFCGNWGHYTLLSWLPTYFCEELHLDLTHAAFVSLLPPLASVVVATIAAPLADHFISRGMDITLVRKVCQSIAFLAPAACMTIASATPNINPWVDVAILTAGIGLSSFALAGLYCTHQDISPKYAGILLGITNTAGAIPGVLGVALVGIIFDQTHSWNLALFAPSIFFYLTGIVVWNVFASSEPQTFTS
ncbi:unnamed protein product [Sphagnum troendelagicum]|uniref:Major facilitator superfamily (MFS) profile domain-containing protein n=1 Tax=Sphagnum troendelagicum TaxID=128251 RepID=A0ABP0TJ94_9BRYO